MRKLILAISAIALAGTAAMADPIADRQALMKANGKAAGVLAPIVKGEKPFDADAVMAALKTIEENSQKLDVATLFPPGSDHGGETTASPKIWEDTALFQSKVDKFKADAAAAFAAAPKDQSELKTQFEMLESNCGGCHETFRIKKS
jgi:cytochrome c556